MTEKFYKVCDIIARWLLILSIQMMIAIVVIDIYQLTAYADTEQSPTTLLENGVTKDLYYIDVDNNEQIANSTQVESTDFDYQNYAIQITDYTFLEYNEEKAGDIDIVRYYYKYTPPIVEPVSVIEQHEEVITYSYGNYGCLVIPCVGIQLPINFYQLPEKVTGLLPIDTVNHLINVIDNYLQPWIDAKNLGAAFNVEKEIVIGDHCDQGFNVIANIPIGSEMYIYKENGAIQKYVCVENGNGINNGLSDMYYNGINIADYNAGGICLYTCQQDWHHVRMVFFQPA